MIFSQKNNSGSFGFKGFALAAAITLPFGLTYAEETKDKPDWDAINKRIEEAVKSGKITREQADERYKQIEQRITAGKDKKTDRVTDRATDRPDWQAIRKRIEGAVERGDITREEAGAKYKAIKERMATGKKRGAKTDRPDWGSIKKRIESAVERGDLTREEADAKYKAIKERMAAGRKRGAKTDRPDWNAIEKRIESAVERGDLTREEADAKYKVLKERFEAHRSDRRQSDKK